MGFLNFSRDFDLFAEKVGTLQGSRMDHGIIDSDFGKNSQNRVGNRVSARRRNSGELWRCKISLRDFLPLSLSALTHAITPLFAGFSFFSKHDRVYLDYFLHHPHSFISFWTEDFLQRNMNDQPNDGLCGLLCKTFGIIPISRNFERVHVSLVLSCDNSEEFDTDAWSLIGQKSSELCKKCLFGKCNVIDTIQWTSDSAFHD